MGQGKYSPRCPNANKNYEYKFNCFGEMPPDYDPASDVYDEQLHFADYDDEGFDRYGYSAFNANGEFVGHGKGIDRLGYREMDYICMSAEDYDDLI